MVVRIKKVTLEQVQMTCQHTVSVKINQQDHLDSDYPQARRQFNGFKSKIL